MERPPFLAMPYPLDEYLDSLPGDYGKIARRTLRTTRRERGTIDGIELDAGEALIDERSEKLWGGLALDRDVLSAAGRRALVRRVLERLERDGIVARRPAQARGPKNSPGNGPRNGPTPTVVRFLKYRDILWRETSGTAQETAQGSAQETARQSGPVLPGKPPDPPSSLRSERAPPAAPAPPPAPKSDHALVVQHWFDAWERAGRGKHASLTEAEGKQLKHLLAEFGLEELRARMDRALADRWFLENGDLLTFVKQRNRFARAGGRAAPVVDERTKRLEAAIARTCPEWAAVLRAAARPVSSGGIDAEVLDGVLVDVEAERCGEVLRLRARDAFHAEVLSDRWQERLTAAARRVTGEPLHVQVVGPAAAAAATGVAA